MSETCDLLISGNINREMVDKILEEVQTAYYRPEKLLRLVIDSPGGSITLALTLARFLTNCFDEIYTYSLSMVDSAAVCLYLCGSKRFACPTSRFFMHPPGVPVNGIQTEQQLKELLQGLQTDTKCMVDYYCERTTVSRSTWEDVFRNTRYLSVTEAHDVGIVTEVCSVIPHFRPHIISTEGGKKTPPEIAPTVENDEKIR